MLGGRRRIVDVDDDEAGRDRASDGRVDPPPGGFVALAGAARGRSGIEEQRLIIFNGGPAHELSPAVSLYVNCETQEEVDRLWAKLSEGGSESRCGWLADRFGLSWQIIPSILPTLLRDPDREKAGRVMNAMLAMAKIDIAALERAAAGH